jgi:hypothetical protein
MRKLLFAASAFLLTAIVLWSCQKELSVETGATPSAPAGGALTTYSWELTGNATKYSGCIDTAYYDNYNGSTFLRVEGTDNLGNFFYILVSASTGKATKGTFHRRTGAGYDGNGCWFKKLYDQPCCDRL